MSDHVLTDTAPETVTAESVPSPRLPLVVHVLALGTFLMLTTEFVVAGILPEIAGDLNVSLGQAGSLITVFAVGMVVGAPLMTLLTIRMSKKRTLVLAMLVFVAGHVVVALATDLTTMMASRFVTALATGAFWAVSAVVASNAAGPASGTRAVGVVAAGGSLATVLGVPIGAMLAQHVGWRGTFWALAVAASIAVVFIARLVPEDRPRQGVATVRSELSDLRSGRLWLVLAACATTTGGVLAAYSFIAPVLVDQAGVSPSSVPLVLTGFGVGSFVGTLIGGRLGDARPHLVTVVIPVVTAVVLAAMALLAGSTTATVVLVVLLGLFGLSANSVLIHLAVRFAGRAATLGSGLAVAAFNAGTALGTTIAGATLTSPLGLTGPAVVGAVIVALTLAPTTALAVRGRHRRTSEPLTP
ncbi:MFS transporter [Tsukamurella pulmonis]|uniref:MFS transporter n=1 Tax=Tsukamurella pulmonis TaxID=47312 RepID=UPI000794D32C|nr:MFS transporter [Tsukamurella pulmonis]KXP11015.1 MFS transporter [Tsukamurella pulmonis]RDH11222.1 MFS transporter [Tsukamurella pulmonis]